jgi:hypothetical protein
MGAECTEVNHSMKSALKKAASAIFEMCFAHAVEKQIEDENARIALAYAG